MGARVLLALWSTLGCSAIFVDKAPPRSPVDVTPPACTESRAAPWVDTSVAAFSVLMSVAALTSPCEELSCVGMGLVLVPMIPLAVGYSASAIWGHHAVGQCRTLRASFAPGEP